MIASISIFLASPSDVETERDIVAATVEQWNAVNSAHRDVVFNLLRWETSVSAGFGADGQQVINAQIGDQYDVLIALFWSRFGSNTPRARSGTVEEYERALSRFQAGEQIEIAFFFKNHPVDFRNVDLENLQRLKDFEQEVQGAGALSKSFKDSDGLRFEINLLLDRLSREAVVEQSPSRSKALGVTQRDAAVLQGIEDADEEEEGLFDVAERLQRSAEPSTAFLEELTERLNILTDVTSGAGEQISSITKLRAIDPSEARPLIEKVAREMNVFSTFLEQRSPSFDEDVSVMVSSIRSLIDISHDFRDSEDFVENLSNFQIMINSLYVSMSTSQESMAGFLGSVSVLQRTTSEFNKAKKRLVRNLQSFISAMDNHRAILAQAVREIEMLIASVQREKY